MSNDDLPQPEDQQDKFSIASVTLTDLDGDGKPDIQISLGLGVLKITHLTDGKTTRVKLGPPEVKELKNLLDTVKEVKGG